MYKLPTFVVLCSLAVSMCVPVENSVNIEVFADKRLVYEDIKRIYKTSLIRFGL